jgi:hypothetical protein
MLETRNGLAEIIAVFVVHGQKDQVEHAHQNEGESEKRDVRLDADRVVEPVARAEKRERHAYDSLQAFERHDGAHPGAHHLALADGQEHHVVHVAVFTAGLEKQKNAERGVEKRHVIGIARDEQERAQREKEKRHRRHGQTPFLLPERLHTPASFSRCTMMFSSVGASS